MNNGHEGRPARRHEKFWTFIRIMNVRMRFVFLMVITGLIAAQWENITAHWERWTRPSKAVMTESGAQHEYYCPMHPSVIRSEPGNCPICGMPLVKRQKGEKEALPEGVVGRVQLSPYRIQLAGVATTEVSYRHLDLGVRTVGTIDVDERRVARVASRVAGRIEKLFLDFTGERVEKGAALVAIYSPDLVSTQQEYLLALKAYRKIQAGGQAQAVADAEAVLDAARERLRLWGVTADQIARIERDGRPDPRMTIYSPIGGIVTQKQVVAGQYVMEGTELYTVADLSNVWMTAYVYERDTDQVRMGQGVVITANGLPGRTFNGKVTFVWPTVDRETRTLRIRVDIPNSGFDLRPGMYVNATIRAGGEAKDASKVFAAGVSYTCPMHPEIVSDRPGNCPICGMNLEKVEAAPSGSDLAVPESAVIDTGSRKVVYLEREDGVFDAVEVELGSPSNGFYPVLKGLSPGDRVVTQGAFLVDAELRLNPGAAGSYFGASGTPTQGESAPAGNGGHQH